ncbi:MAG TPA: NAD(P)H-hydrate dehydratase, partial [Alphaproteobacteria bacterium]|nr:NAD(P)H-hydrate dehydratase [Alphaproteobacteria bacterium]
DAALLTCGEMARADARAVARGIASERLMEAAGGAVAEAVHARFEKQPVAVLCGPGNNGGDGFVAARLLAEADWPVELFLLGRVEDLEGEAKLNAARWRGAVKPLEPTAAEKASLVIDALFGAGLTRPIEGTAAEVIARINARSIPCVGVDVPSGVHGDTGAVMGAAPRCQLTVTFFRLKPGHLLLPGRALCGETILADIGIPADVLTEIGPTCHINGPALWRDAFPWPRLDGHKYDRGHAIVIGGAAITGAARLAARAALRTGAGLVTVASEPVALPIYAADRASFLTAAIGEPSAFDALLGDARKNAILLGPGNGADLKTQARVRAAFAARKRCVLDADAITAFADEPDALFRAIHSPCVLTPHEGEFRRIFSVSGDKLSRAREAARVSGAVVLLKGADTVIAAPDGRAVINANAPPTLATAGAGDVLGGIILGLLAQGMEPFAAACAAAWLHGAAAHAYGPGLIAEDLPEMLPNALRVLRESDKK